MGTLIRTLMSIPLFYEALGLIVLAIILFTLSRRLYVRSHLYRHEIPILLLTTGIGLLIPGGWALFLAILYICWRIFQEALYSVCPPCWQRLGSWIAWLRSHIA
jgi:hypothetical protein